MGKEYGPDDIQVLTGLAPIRKRPAMYIGDVDRDGVQNLVFEVVGNVVDLHLRRDATEVLVELSSDGWCTVRDDGPGIPIDVVPHSGKSALETVFTSLHAGATYDGHHPHVHLTQGMFGVGVAAVSALSMRVEVETTRAGVRYAQAFARGEVASPLRELGPTTIEGTTVRFQPDPEIFFKGVAFDEPRIAARLQELAWLNPLLHVYFQERRLPSRGGVRGWAAELATAPIVARFSTCQELDDVYVDLALAWTEAKDIDVHCFVNMSRSVGGSHVEGIWQGLAAAADALEIHDSPVRLRERLEPGLIALVHVGLFQPQWGSPSRDQLVSPAAGMAVARLLARTIPQAARRNPALLARLRGESRVVKHMHR